MTAVFIVGVVLIPGARLYLYWGINDLSATYVGPDEVGGPYLVALLANDKYQKTLTITLTKVSRSCAFAEIKCDLMILMGDEDHIVNEIAQNFSKSFQNVLLEK